MKRCSTSLITCDMRVKSTIKYHLTSARKSIILKKKKERCYRGCGKNGNLCTVAGGKSGAGQWKPVWRLLKKLKENDRGTRPPSGHIFSRTKPGPCKGRCPPGLTAAQPDTEAASVPPGIQQRRGGGEDDALHVRSTECHSALERRGRYHLWWPLCRVNEPVAERWTLHDAPTLRNLKSSNSQKQSRKAVTGGGREFSRNRSNGGRAGWVVPEACSSGQSL